MLPVHCARAEPNFAAAVEASIIVGGCTSSRASIAGAVHGALATDAAIPLEWLSILHQSERAQQLAAELVDLRNSVVTDPES